MCYVVRYIFFFFNDTATTEIYTLSLHDALPISTQNPVDLDYKALSNAGTWFIGKLRTDRDRARLLEGLEGVESEQDRKSTRLNSSHANISYAVFCLKKKK